MLILAGLVPSSATDNARASMVVHAIYDTGLKMEGFLFEWDDDKKVYVTATI